MLLVYTIEKDSAVHHEPDRKCIHILKMKLSLTSIQSLYHTSGLSWNLYISIICKCKFHKCWCGWMDGACREGRSVLPPAKASMWNIFWPILQRDMKASVLCLGKCIKGTSVCNCVFFQSECLHENGTNYSAVILQQIKVIPLDSFTHRAGC